MQRTVLFAVAALAAACASAAPTVENEALRASKGVLVLQCGSDWCVSGEDVRSVFNSAAFKKNRHVAQFVTAVYDEMDSPTDDVRAKNDLVKSMLIRTKRFPAITCFTPGPEFKVFAQIENIPSSVTAEKLAGAIAKTVATKDKAEALFKKAAQAKGEAAADLYGEGFDLLATRMGPFHFKELTTGKFAWKKEWGALCELDAGDRFGWLAHFDMDEYKTVKMVEKVTGMRESPSGSIDQYVKSVKSIPQKHFTPNQKQAVKVVEYAATGSTGKALSQGERKLMEEAFALGRDTFWGQFAMGRLMMDGAKIESKGLPAAKVRERPKNASGTRKPFPLEQAKSAIASIKPGAKLTDQQKMAVARYTVLRLIGVEGWNKVHDRPGGQQFMATFMNDREWLEDFAWSGSFPVPGDPWNMNDVTTPGAAAGAIDSLEELVFQDNGRWTEFADGKYENNEGRKFMTALALVYPSADSAWLADVLDAYRATALAGRLHKAAYSQPVWQWRFAVHQGHPTAGVDNMAAQQRHLDKFVNLPLREYSGTPWMIEYRLKNCFGDSVHGPLYYKPWATAGEWPKRKYSQIVGGVCGELSKFGSAISNSHGLPSTTVGQPGHCAYSRRLPDGDWILDYNVTGHSQMHMCFWGKHEWQYCAAIEKTYNVDRELRLGAERMIALACLAEDRGRDRKTVENFYRHACAAYPEHYGAWKLYGDWLMRTNTPLDELRVWVRGCARGMKTGRQPLWNILTPYFERVAKEKGVAALKADLLEFAPLLKQGQGKLQEEADFSTVLQKWGELLGSDELTRYDVLKAMLVAQFGTREYFSQTLGWGSDYYTKIPGGMEKFVKCLSEVFALGSKKSGGKGKEIQSGIDFKPLMLSASKNGNLEAFRIMANLQNKLSPRFKKGADFPSSDFGNPLLSGDGLLMTSTTSSWDDPSRYQYVIDASAPDGNGFHTAKEKAPWATVKLPGPSSISGVVVVNNSGGYNATRQAPLFVDVSRDGTTWTRVHTDENVRDTYRIDLRASAPLAQYVRVGRVENAKEEVYHLSKILVYGKKFY